VSDSQNKQGVVHLIDATVRQRHSPSGVKPKAGEIMFGQGNVGSFSVRLSGGVGFRW
jgi:hypothetical protein